MKLFRRHEIPPDVKKAREALDEAEKATTEADKAVKQYWTIRRQYAKAEAQRRRRST